MQKCSKCGKEKDFNEFRCRTDRNSQFGVLRKQCKECIAKNDRLRYKKNCEKMKAQARENYQKNIEERKAVQKKWRQTNSGKKNALCMKRYTAKLRRTPKWLSKSDWTEINWAYQIAADRSEQTGIPHEVDHIIPLQGKWISGLHVPWNLQIITEAENLRKYNK